MHFGAGRTAPSTEPLGELGSATANGEQSLESGAVAEGSDCAAAVNSEVNGETEASGGSGQDAREHSEADVSDVGGHDANKVESQEATSESEELATGPAAAINTSPANGDGGVKAASVDASAGSAATAASMAPALVSATSVEDNGEDTLVTEAALNQLLDRCCILHCSHFSPSQPRPCACLKRPGFDLVCRFVAHTDGCNCKQLQHVHARLAGVAWLHRHANDKRSALRVRWSALWTLPPSLPPSPRPPCSDISHAVGVGFCRRRQELELVADALEHSAASRVAR